MRLTAGLALAFAATLYADGEMPDARLVRFDAIVTDARGRAVDNLRLEDVHLAEGASALTLESVRFVKADGRPSTAAAPSAIQSADDERTEAARPGARVFALFLDEYHVSPEATARVKELARTFVSGNVGAGDLMIVLRPLDPLLALRLTRDRDAVLREVEEFEGRLGQYQPRNDFERNFIAGDPARVEATRAQITISALHALATHLGRIADARKTALVITEGFVPREIRRGGQLLPTLDSVIRASNHANVSWYPVDPRAFPAVAPATGDAGSAVGKQWETVRRLAEETDGRAIGSVANAAELAAGLRRVVDDASGYYVMTFRGADDGRFHPLDVHVNRPGAQVRARPGYWAVSAEEVARIQKASIPPAPRPALPPPTHVSPLIRPWFGVARGDDGQSRVTMVWEPARRVTGDRIVTLAPARLKVTASTPEGRSLYEGVVVPAGAPAVDGESTQAVFNVPPGRVRLQMSVEDAASRVLDTDVREVMVGGLTGAVAIATPEVMRARTARDLRTAIASPEAIPTAAREFSRVEQLVVRLKIYGDREPVVTANLLNRRGQAMRALTVEKGHGSGAYTLAVPLSGLAAGNYTIALRATAANAEAREAVNFRVTP
jgi:VWFA-related protein